ncbi:MAG: class I SAM-dependent rRNA methyltransferase [Eubacteriales bacterium]|nr:class I SAM-dependent rRNA methyltransferase [Eubacteriales bacterium]
MDRKFTRIHITEKGERAARRGHPWVFSDEITDISGNYSNGDLVDVYSGKERYIGTGYINDNSKIRVRIISRNANDKFDADFYRRRIKYAFEYRKTVMGDDFSSCRLIFGEADCFPGLTVDKFEDVLVLQILSLGIEKIKDILIPLMVETLVNMGEKINAVYERNDVKIRELEGMKEYKGFYRMEGLASEGDGLVTITENGIKYTVDYINGQKTGFFLDQKYNRLAVRRIAKGRKVLDCFTHTGAFALNAAAAGALSVTAVDVSEEALSRARSNAEMNNLFNVSFECRDVFDLLTTLENEKRHDYDFIILDPPAFTKSSQTVNSAYRGYKDINMRAMKLLPRGGYLATCSCSHFMGRDNFIRMLNDAAADAGVSLRQVEERQQSFDHPILYGVYETDYLKFFIFQVV